MLTTLESDLLEAVETESADSTTDIAALIRQMIRDYSLENLFSAILTLIICLTLIRLTMKIINRLLGHTHIDQRAKTYITVSMKTVLYILMIVIVAQGLGINMNSFVALLSVFSLGITLAAEDFLGNLAGGIVIFSTHPFVLEDIVESSGNIGVVKEITVYHTKLLNIDGQYILIPNKDLAASRIINYTTLGRRRVTVKIFAAYDASTLEVKGACRYALDMTKNILKDPEPAVRLTAYGSNAIEYSVFCWVLPADYLNVMYDLNENLREAFARSGVEMTYDHLNVHLIPPKSANPDTENQRGQYPDTENKHRR